MVHLVHFGEDIIPKLCQPWIRIEVKTLNKFEHFAILVGQSLWDSSMVATPCVLER